MRKLNLPVIQNSFVNTKHLSMDEYLKFTLLHLKYTFSKENYKMWKNWQVVNIPFSLK